MAFAGTWPTLLDVAKRLDPDGKIAIIAEVLDKVNPILDDMPVIEGNLQTGHQGTIRTGLPTVAWRLLNYGVLPSKSTTKQVVDVAGILEAWGEIDSLVYELNGARDAFRMSEDMAHVEGMSQEMASTIFYGDTQVNPERFLGLHPRYINLTGDETSGQIVNAGGVGVDNSSIWLISWGERTIHGFYPKGTQAGLEVDNKGMETKTASDGRLQEVFRTRFRHRLGLHLKDFQAVARLANIDNSAPPAAAALIDFMIDLISKIPPRLRNGNRMVMYTNVAIETILNKAALTAAVNQLTVDKLKNGEPLVRFWGIPIRIVEALTSAEVALT